MIRDTSIEAYKEIIDSGLLGKRESKTYKGLFDHGPCTDRELAEELGYDDPNAIRPRRANLCEKGLVESCGKKTCSISGKKVYEWRIKQDATIDGLKKLEDKKVKKENDFNKSSESFDKKDFVERLIKNVKKSDFGKDIWYFKQVIYEVADIELPKGDWELQCQEYKNTTWETFYTGTEDEVKGALEWNQRNAKMIDSKKRFRVIKV